MFSSFLPSGEGEAQEDSTNSQEGGNAMSLCASCGSSLRGDTDLCSHHHTGKPDDWAQANRLMCDFLHRKWIPPALEDLLDDQSKGNGDSGVRTGGAA